MSAPLVRKSMVYMAYKSICIEKYPLECATAAIF